MLLLIIYVITRTRKRVPSTLWVVAKKSFVFLTREVTHATSVLTSKKEPPRRTVIIYVACRPKSDLPHTATRAEYPTIREREREKGTKTIRRRSSVGEIKFNFVVRETRGATFVIFNTRREYFVHKIVGRFRLRNKTFWGTAGNRSPTSRIPSGF